MDRATATSRYWEAALAMRGRSPLPLSRRLARDALTALACKADPALARVATRAAQTLGGAEYGFHILDNPHDGGRAA